MKKNSVRLVMRIPRHWLLQVACIVFLLNGTIAATAFGQQRPAIAAQVLEERFDLANPAERSRAVARMRGVEEQRKAAAVARARQLGLPLRVVGPDHQVAELMDFEDDRPLYAVTTNREAEISTAADLTRSSFGVDGSGFTIGVWDGGAVRATHQEFVGRVNTIDNVSPVAHATHVAGTIAAAGVTLRARGMSPAATIDSYDWNSDMSQMTSRGASYPGEPGKLYISNHSYGYRSGWEWTDRWEWFGSGTTQSGVDPNFGRYNNFARDMDSLAYNLPYYLTFWAAGNDRSDNPTNGSTVRIGGNLVAYDSSIHPAGDGVYKGGYDTIGFQSVAKNVLTVGSINDAVSFGVRDLSQATMSGFSSWGPTDDGRIKPDIVANGASVYSPTASTNSSYGNMSGTSMAAPNATGSAQLLVSYFDRLFPGHAMRASTLKGLIIHTADDLGTPGPNYQFGWGLMNTEQAAAHIASHSTSPGSQRMVEAQLTGGEAAHTYSFTWDGISPIRVTLVWTDPAAPATTSHDNRTSRLVNNLDLVVHGPGGSVHDPYVMPYVGNWNPDLLSAPATTGKNNTDNVEQVFIASPPASGIYTASVTVDGTLTNNSQYYSLLISGSTDTVADAPALTALSPNSSSSAVTAMTLDGSGFQVGSTVGLELSGAPPREAFSHVVTPKRITARIDTEAMAGGFWDVVVTNPDGQRAVLPAAFSVAAPFWSENFEGSVAGWSAEADTGSTGWELTQARSRSPSHAYFAPGISTQRIDTLYSPVIEIPSEATDLSLRFWHAHEFGSNHGGVIEFSFDGVNWFDPSTGPAGETFVSGGYNGTLQGGGSPNVRNALGSRPAWVGDRPEFSEVVLTLPASAYAGKNLQIRWRLGSNNTATSPGWYIDDVALAGAGVMAVPVPIITTAAQASEAPVTGTAVELSVEAQNSDGSSGLTYTWTVNDSREYPVTFEDNGSETAYTTTATFSRAGAYLFEVKIQNAFDQVVSSEVEVEVLQTATTLLIEPATAVVPLGQKQTFSATTTDQFGLSLDPQPLPQWTIDPAAGSVSTDGIFLAAMEPGGPFLLTATSAGISGTANIYIRALEFADWQQTHFSSDELADPMISGDHADPDGDGVYNLLEYALGGNPRQSNRGVLPMTLLEQTEAGTDMVFTFTRPAGIADLEYRVQASSDLVNWSPLPAETWRIESDGMRDTVTIRRPVPEDGARFLRLTVQREGL